MGINRVFNSLFVVAALIPSHRAFAWGPVAHEAVALIAEKNLTVKTEQAVGQILGGRKLVEVATWPDAIRQSAEWQHTKSYHFTHVPDRTPYLLYVKNESKDSLAKGDVVRAILKAAATLRSRQTRREDRANAVAFLTHFIGDLHQPLHTGRKEDRGGNEISVSWFGKRSNLHQIWDSHILETAHADKLKGAPEAEQSRIYARLLLEANVSRGSPNSAGSIENWLDDSLKTRELAYRGPLNDLKLLTRNAIGPLDDLVFSAGFRLAAILNMIFDSNQALPLAPRVEPTRFEQQLARLLGGDATFGVSLQPASEVNPNRFLARGARPTTPKTRLSSVLTSPRTPTDKQFWIQHDCDNQH